MAITAMRKMDGQIKSTTSAANSLNRMIDDYKISNQNSVYYLQPNTNEMYLLDLKKRSFVKEQLKWSPDTPVEK